jgi:hypothetical protein
MLRLSDVIAPTPELHGLIRAFQEHYGGEDASAFMQLLGMPLNGEPRG